LGGTTFAPAKTIVEYKFGKAAAVTVREKKCRGCG